MNKRGELSILTLINWGIVAFITVLLFGGLIWSLGQIKDTFDEIGLKNEVNAEKDSYVNMSKISNDIWGKSFNSILFLRILATIYILSLAGSIVIVGFLERKHPFLFIVYILFTLLAVIFAPTISNAYEAVLNSGLYGGELANFGASNLIILNLPLFVLTIGTLGGIGLFINLIRTGEEEKIRW